ncbi:MAG: tRNA (N(6)-L-threonylcarbamoyladenosine(37)-C(2))-methylthiotransferase MtaB, partial [Clostridiales bacterium]|nr:tRNA (N(6)-L-threonylcarbamoyladenosine(37)-C(2))-methylthiotransferase MtaB [Clostridiales bacterium]
MKYAITTLGCKVNQVETYALSAMLEEKGFSHIHENEKADVIIVNTCAVTAESGRKSRQAIRKLKSEHPHAISVVCGCFSQLSPEQVSELGADVVHGSGSKKRLMDDIERALNAKGCYIWADDPFSRREIEELEGGAVEGRTRAMLKIQDGCVNFCTYCIIPYTRGRIRSLEPERCAKQVEELAKKGFRELVITGIEIASYGRDLEPRCNLADAVETIAASSGDMRIRLGSLEPTVITEDFCKRLRQTGKVCDHFHLSLQSGCDETLRRMNRKYDTERFYEACRLLREHFPDCALTADLIVGFPAESEQDHKKTLDFIKRCDFSSMHIFPYSIRTGTKAAQMQGQLSNAEKSKRAKSAKEISDIMEKNYLSSCKGKVLEVLFETEQEGVSIGHAANHAQVCVGEGQLRGLV